MQETKMTSTRPVSNCTFIITQLEPEWIHKIVDLGFSVRKSDTGLTCMLTSPSREAINCLYDIFDGQRNPVESANFNEEDGDSFTVIDRNEAKEAGGVCPVMDDEEETPSKGIDTGEGRSSCGAECISGSQNYVLLDSFISHNGASEAKKGSDVLKSERHQNIDGGSHMFQKETDHEKAVKRVAYIEQNPYDPKTADQEFRDDAKRNYVSSEGNHYLDNDFGQGKELSCYETGNKDCSEDGTATQEPLMEKKQRSANVTEHDICNDIKECKPETELQSQICESESRLCASRNNECRKDESILSETAHGELYGAKQQTVLGSRRIRPEDISSNGMEQNEREHALGDDDKELLSPSSTDVCRRQNAIPESDECGRKGVEVNMNAREKDGERVYSGSKDGRSRGELGNKDKSVIGSSSYEDEQNQAHHNAREEVAQVATTEEEALEGGHGDTNGDTLKSQDDDRYTHGANDHENNQEDGDEDGEEHSTITTLVFAKGEYKFAEMYFRNNVEYENVSQCLRNRFEQNDSYYTIEIHDENSASVLNRFKNNLKKERVPREMGDELKKVEKKWGTDVHVCRDETRDCFILITLPTFYAEIEKAYPNIFSGGAGSTSTHAPSSNGNTSVSDKTTDASPRDGGQAGHHTSLHGRTSDRGVDVNVGSSAMASTFRRHYSNLRVQVSKESITDLKVDVIVNAANKSLKHGGGVARAIAKAAGDKLKHECSKYTEKGGTVHVSYHFESTGGKLPVKKIYHAVGPKWQHYESPVGCRRDLRRTVLGCLLHAERDGHRSIAFPSISAAIFKVPKEICVESYMEAVLHFEKLRVSENIQLVQFVDIDDNMVNDIKEQFFNCWDNTLNENSQEFASDRHHFTPIDSDTRYSGNRSASRSTKIQNDVESGYGTRCLLRRLERSPEKATPSSYTHAGMYPRGDVASSHDTQMSDRDTPANTKRGTYHHVDVASGQGTRVSDRGTPTNNKTYTYHHGDVASGHDTHMSYRGTPTNNKTYTYHQDDVASGHDTHMSYRGTPTNNKTYTYHHDDVASGHDTHMSYRGTPTNNKTYTYHQDDVASGHGTRMSDRGTPANTKTDTYPQDDVASGHDTHMSYRGTPTNNKTYTYPHDDVASGHGTRMSDRDTPTNNKTDTYPQDDVASGHGTRMSDRGTPANTKTDTYHHGDVASGHGTQMSDRDTPANTKRGTYHHGDVASGQGTRVSDRGTPTNNKTDTYHQDDVQAGRDTRRPLGATAMRTKSTSFGELCGICQESKYKFEVYPCCSKYVCSMCFSKLKSKCPFCMTIHGILTGDMPDGRMRVFERNQAVPGYPRYSGHYEIGYYFREFHSTMPLRIAYLPNDREGDNALILLIVAFMRRLTFTRGTSRTTGKENQVTWNGIHHKTTLKAREPYGYPDSDYFRRLSEELKVQGVTMERISDEEYATLYKYRECLRKRGGCSVLPHVMP